MITIDYANCLSTRVGAHGLNPSILDPASSQSKRATELTAQLNASSGTGWERWRPLPRDPMRSAHTTAINAIIDPMRDATGKPRFENLVVLGIGGSALGNIALQAALNPSTYNLLPREHRAGPRVFVVDNVDPAHLAAVLDMVLLNDPTLENTLFNVVSKSGETAETASQFMTIRDLLISICGKDNHADHIVAITDPERGTMRTICDANGYTTLPVPDGVGGRFSVLSPVGLFSAAMAGIDIEALLDGAAEMDERCQNPDMLANPAALLATLLCELGDAGKVNHVMMPYASGLYLMADWFRQLWAESLGKRFALDGKTEVFTGYTPIKALGTTDQHSQVQLYREGPNDKAFCLLEVESFAGAPGDRGLTIPKGLGIEPLSYLEGRSFEDLLMAEKRATEFALVESLRPNLTIRFPKIDARSIGQFIQLFEVTTAYAGKILGIDAYDQPAVETGKLATFGLMGREGYTEWESKVNQKLAPTSHTL